MKKFLLNLLLFCIPIALVYSLPTALYLLSREFLPLREVVARQQAQPDTVAGSNQILYDAGVDALYAAYKVEAVKARNPDIMVLGTSRTLTIQSQFFKHPDAFYNAGSTAGQTFRTADLLAFLDAMPKDSKLKVILLDTSSLLTEPAAGKSDNFSMLKFYETLYTATWRNIYIDYYEKKFSLLNLIKTENTNKNIGVLARLQNAGFRKDGSYERNTKESPAQLQAQVQRDLALELKLLVPGQGGFADYSATIPQTDVDELNKFLAACQARRIYVIGYLSPFATELAAKMESLGDAYTKSYNQTPMVLSQTLKTYGFPFYDIRDL